MGQLNAHGHMLTAMAGGPDQVWDLLVELCERSGRIDGHGRAACPVLHGLGASSPDTRRYCLHPTGDDEDELRGDDLMELLIAGCIHVAERDIDEHVTWRRD